MDVRAYNRAAWDRQVETGNRWTVPVDADRIARARAGDWSVVLTPLRPVPGVWFPPLEGARVLALACGGGQQAPILAALGARVTVLDNSPRQLQRDAEVASREGLEIDLLEGDMRDLSALSDASFDLVFHPVSNCFVPDIRSVWREAARVLRPGGTLLAGFCNPIVFLTDPVLEADGILRIKSKVPYSDLEALSEAERRTAAAAGEPLAFGHSLEDQIAGQIEAGFVITGFYEDTQDPALDLLSRFVPGYIATRAVKPLS
jgi:SAM-dependent methyltransferase